MTNESRINEDTQIRLSLVIKVFGAILALSLSIGGVIWWAAGINENVNDIPEIKMSLEMIRENQIKILTRLNIYTGESDINEIGYADEK